MINPTLEDFKKLNSRLNPYFIRTGITKSIINNNLVFLKREDSQYTNSFTYRAAVGILMSLTEEQLKNGIVLTTPGNLGVGILRAINLFLKKDVRVCLVLPEDAVEKKMQLIKLERSKSVKIISKGFSESERYSVVEEISKKEGYEKLNLVNRNFEFLSKATVVKEFFDQIIESNEFVKNDDWHFYCPIGSGALIAGSAWYLKNLFGSKVKIIGVEPSYESDFYNHYYKKSFKVEDTNKNISIADSLRSPNVRREFAPFLFEYLDRVEMVSEFEIENAMRYLFDKLKILAEPSAAVGFAAILKNNFELSNLKLSTIITAANLDENKFKFLQ